MNNEILEKIKSESESLYYEIQKGIKKKWGVSNFEKISPELFMLKVYNIKRPEKTMNVKCVFAKCRWYLLGDQ